MKKKLFIHIGIQRTSTTSIQSFTSKNRSELLNKGVFPGRGGGRNFAFFQRLIDKKLTAAEASASLVRAAEEASDGVHSIILSDERLCMLQSLEVFKEFRDYFDVKVVFFLRRQDLWLQSWYLQNVKWQWNKELSHITVEDFLNKRAQFHWLDFEKLIKRWADCFGKENIKPAIFEREQMPEGPICKFCNLIGIDDCSGLETDIRVNESFSLDASEFMRRLPLHELSDKQRLVVEKSVLNVPLENKLKGSIVSGEKSLSILEDYEVSNRRVAQEHFGRDYLFLEGLPNLNEPVVDINNISGDELLSKFAGPVIKTLVGRKDL